MEAKIKIDNFILDAVVQAKITQLEKENKELKKKLNSSEQEIIYLKSCVVSKEFKKLAQDLVREMDALRIIDIGEFQMA